MGFSALSLLFPPSAASAASALFLSQKPHLSPTDRLAEEQGPPSVVRGEGRALLHFISSFQIGVLQYFPYQKRVAYSPHFLI